MTPRQAPNASRTASGASPAVASAAVQAPSPAVAPAAVHASPLAVASAAVNASPPDLLRVAKRMVWFKEPVETLRDPVLFLCHVMTYGTVADIAATREHFSDDLMREALRLAHPGIFDARSWTYWHIVLDVQPVPPLPTRRLPE